MKRATALILLCIFALVGFLDASYVHVEEIHARTNPTVLQSCSINAVISCAPVLTSRYATIAGVPVSQFGMYFYEAILLIGLAFIVGLPLQRWLIWGISIFVGASLLFSGYLLFMSYFAIGAFCPFCLVSDLSALGVTVCWFLFVARLSGKGKA